MKNILKKSWLVGLLINVTISGVYADVISFSAAEIASGTTKSGVTASSSYTSTTSNKQICKEGSTATKTDVIEIKNTASTVAENYFEIKSSTDIISIILHAVTNASDAADEVILMSQDASGVTNDNISACALINLPGYAGACDANYTTYNLSSSAKSFRMYRQVKKFDTSSLKVVSSGGSNYGSGKTFYVVDVDVVVGESAPAVTVTGISLNKTSLTLEQGNEETLTATISPSDATNQGVTWSSSDATVASVADGKVTALAVGTATITATADGDNTKTATCTVNVIENTHPTAVESITLSKTTLSLKVGATETLTYTITPQNATNKNVSWSSSAAAIAGVDNTGKVTANAEGTATITVKTADGNKTATCAVTVTAANPVPETDLTLHEPEVYEAKGKNGYGADLTIYNDREYEVYYINRDSNGKVLVLSTSNEDKTGSISDEDNSTDKTTVTKDGWATISGSNGTGGDTNASAKDEFLTSLRCVKMNSNSHELALHISGYDQFNFYGKDNNTNAEKGKMFEVYIDDVKQDRTPHDYDIERFDLTPKEHVIRVTAIGGSDSKLCSFSLRVSQTPRVSHHKGNDSTQTILCGKTMQDVVYRVKYNEDTRLEWVGNAPTGVTLEKRGTAGVTDTLAVVGTPIGAAGVYTYRVVAYQNGAEVSEKTGKFTIQTKLIALTDTIVEGYVGEDIDEVQFQYYAPAESDVTVQWTSSTPAGIQTATAKNIFTISGVPTAAGNFPFAVSVAGGNSIKGELIITGSEIEANTILYLYKNKDTYNKGNIYKALKAAGYKLTERKIKTTGQRADEQYKKFIMVVISEDADATAQEALDICSRTDFPTPVLNLKSFTYSTSRLGWGYPNNGVFSNAAITVQQPSHPIFKGLNATQGGSIDILTINTAEELRKGIMPAEINNCSGSYCLAIAPKDSKEYGALGDLAVAIHEIPASLHGSKYILLPLGSECVLSSAGNTLLKNIVSYLTDASSDSGIQLPDLRISRFEVNGKQALIDEDASTISLSLEPGTDLTAIKPVITLAGTATVVMPDNKEAQNFAEHARDGITYVVTDYVNRHAYQVYITAEGTGLNDNTAEGIYFDGTTLHNPNGIALYVLDMMGRIMTYSNSNVDMSDFGHGMYLITTGSNSMKVVK